MAGLIYILLCLPIISGLCTDAEQRKQVFKMSIFKTGTPWFHPNFVWVNPLLISEEILSTKNLIIYHKVSKPKSHNFLTLGDTG